jgi:D-aminopeptidase
MVGNADDAKLCSGVTVVLSNRTLIAAVDVRGGGPATRETDALGLAGTVDEVHAIVLSGGSAFGLSAATGAQCWLAEQGRGFEVRGARVPIVAQASLFDLLNGGNKSWGESPPYEALARKASNAAAPDFALGSAGAGYGASTATFRGGLGSASAVLPSSIVVGALVAVNAVGSATFGSTRHFWASAFEEASEFGGHGFPSGMDPALLSPRFKGQAGEATTLAVVATNARLTKREAHRLAVMAQSGLSRALYPAHTPLDGDTVFAASTGEIPLRDPIQNLTAIGIAAANVLARAIARGVYEAAVAPPNWCGPPAYRTLHPRPTLIA